MAYRGGRYYNAGVSQPGPRYMHYPDDESRGYDEAYFRGLISERVKIVQARGVATEKWVKIHERNEPLDINNYCRAAAVGFRIDLDAMEKRVYGEKEIQPAQLGPRKPRGLISRGIQI